MGLLALNKTPTKVLVMKLKPRKVEPIGHLHLLVATHRAVKEKECGVEQTVNMNMLMNRYC